MRKIGLVVLLCLPLLGCQYQPTWERTISTQRLCTVKQIPLRSYFPSYKYELTLQKSTDNETGYTQYLAYIDFYRAGKLSPMIGFGYKLVNHYHKKPDFYWYTAGGYIDCTGNQGCRERLKFQPIPMDSIVKLTHEHHEHNYLLPMDSKLPAPLLGITSQARAQIQHFLDKCG